MIRKLLIALALLVPTAAQAEWHVATSPNFEVYSEGSEQDARDFAARLERFNFVLRTFHRVTAPPAANRLRVFLLSSGGGVARMAGAPGSGIAGYYVPDARAQMLVGTRSRANLSAGALDPETILLHEYTHHFMYQYFPATYPTWYSEGYAEFWGATQLLDNDVVEVGLPAEHRFATFHILGWLPLERLLRVHNYSEAPGENVFLLYAEGWLLVRYVFEHPERKRQLDQYLSLINRGVSYDQAARQAFPDLGRFNDELYNYAGAARYNVVRLPFRTIDVGQITLRTPGPAEQALMDHEIRLSQGYEQREAAEFASDVQAIASRFPEDPFAIRMVMESQFLANNFEAAGAAADHLLRLQPENARALVTRGRIQIAALRSAQSTDRAAWDAARQYLLRAQRAAQRDPIVLEALYDSYAAQSGLPPDEVQNALYDAHELAPSDAELRYKLARDFEQRGMIPEAIAIIRPEAWSTPIRRGESESERQRRQEREERNRQAGRERHETALEMLTRLETRLSERDRERQAEASAPQSN